MTLEYEITPDVFHIPTYVLFSDAKNIETKTSEFYSLINKFHYKNKAPLGEIFKDSSFVGTGKTLAYSGEQAPPIILIWFDYNCIYPGVIAHEAFHVAYNVAEILGIKLSRNSEETFAYLIDYYVSRINEAVKQFKKDRLIKSKLTNKKTGVK